MIDECSVEAVAAKIHRVFGRVLRSAPGAELVECRVLVEKATIEADQPFEELMQNKMTEMYNNWLCHQYHERLIHEYPGLHITV